MSDEIECRDCDGNGTVETGQMEAGPAGIGFERGDCRACNGRGWREPTDEERDDAAADAFSDLCEGEPPMSADEHYRAAAEQKRRLRS